MSIAYEVVALIACFGKRMPCAFAAASPDCRIAAERCCSKGYELKTSEGRYYYCSSITPPDKTKKEERYLTTTNMRKVTFRCGSKDSLIEWCDSLSWWWYRQRSRLPLKLKPCISERAPVDATEIVSSKQLHVLVVSLDGGASLYIRGGAEQLVNLESLAFSANSKLVELAKITTCCSRLRYLEMNHCEIDHSTAISEARCLRSLELYNCKGSIDLSDVKRLPDLVELRIFCCDDLTNVSVLQEMSNLQSLELKGVKSFGVDSLQSMHLKDFEWHDDYPHPDLRILGQTSLRKVKLLSCSLLVSLDGLEKAQQLEELSLVRGALETVKLPPLASLRVLELRQFRNLTSVSGLENTPMLSRLHLDSTAIETLHLPPLPHLTKLYFPGCKKLATLTGLRNAPNICGLNLGNTQVADVRELSYCASLETISLARIFKDSGDPSVDLLLQRGVNVYFS